MTNAIAIVIALVGVLLATFANKRIDDLERQHVIACSQGIAVMTPSGAATTVCNG